MLKQNKGITLVALVITIIVMLILAGVSISLVVGDNGVLNQATTAADKSSKANAESEISLALSSAQADFVADNPTYGGDGWGTTTYDDLMDYIYSGSGTTLETNITKYIDTDYAVEVTDSTTGTDDDGNTYIATIIIEVNDEYTATITRTSEVSATIEFD